MRVTILEAKEMGNEGNRSKGGCGQRVLYYGWLCVCICIILSSIVMKGEAQSNAEKISKNVCDAAIKADAEYRKVMDPKVFHGPEYEIPPMYWNDTLTSVNPVRVYNHKGNIVIALKNQDGVEEGVYIYINISSFIPAPELGKMDGFTFYYPRNGNMINYRRDK